MTNFKSPPAPFHVDIINVWSLSFCVLCNAMNFLVELLTSNESVINFFMDKDRKKKAVKSKQNLHEDKFCFHLRILVLQLLVRNCNWIALRTCALKKNFNTIVPHVNVKFGLESARITAKACF